VQYLATFGDEVWVWWDGRLLSAIDYRGVALTATVW